MKYKQYYEEEDTGWTEWVEPVRKGYKMCCCDCNLVHNLNFRIHKGKIQFQVQRNNRATAACRRKKKKNS